MKPLAQRVNEHLSSQLRARAEWEKLSTETQECVEAMVVEKMRKRDAKRERALVLALNVRQAMDSLTERVLQDGVVEPYWRDIARTALDELEGM